jgi:L1 cell adhesion molecule like protein
VQDDKKHWTFDVEKGANDKCLIPVKYQGQDKKFSPEEISSFILSKLKEDAEKFLGKPVKDVVITVPAHFN